MPVIAAKAAIQCSRLRPLDTGLRRYDETSVIPVFPVIAAKAWIHSAMPVIAAKAAIQCFRITCPDTGLRRCDDRGVQWMV